MRHVLTLLLMAGCCFFLGTPAQASLIPPLSMQELLPTLSLPPSAHRAKKVPRRVPPPSQNAIPSAADSVSAPTAALVEKQNLDTEEASGAPQAPASPGAGAISHSDSYYLPLTCVVYDDHFEGHEYEVQKGGVIERKVRQPEGRLTVFAVKTGDSLRETLKRWAAPDQVFLWEADADTDFEFQAPANFGKDRQAAVSLLMNAVRSTMNLQLRIYSKNNVWALSGSIPASLCTNQE